MGAVLDVFNVLHEPSAVFTRLKDKPRILAPWLVVSAFVLVLAVLSLPYQAAAMDALRATLPPEQAARVAPQPLWRTIVGAPIVVLIGLLIGGGLLWVGVMLLGGQARFKTTMSVLAYSNMTYVLFAVVTTIVVRMRGVGAVSSFADLRAPLGLDLVIPGASLFSGMILNGINPFSIWGVWLCGTGLAITQGVSRAGAIVVTAIIYLFCLTLQAAPLLLLGAATRQ